MNKPKPPIDFETLKRAITLGSAEAARDAGLVHFAVAVTIEPVLVEIQNEPTVIPAIQVEIAELSEAEAAALRQHEPN